MLQPPVPLRRPTTGARILVLRDGPPAERPDRLATEEPMEIRAHGPGQEPVSVSVTMRTPGHDFELAVGFLFTEGLIDGTGDVGAVAEAAEQGGADTPAIGQMPRREREKQAAEVDGRHDERDIEAGEVESLDEARQERRDAEHAEGAHSVRRGQQREEAPSARRRGRVAWVGRHSAAW